MDYTVAKRVYWKWLFGKVEEVSLDLTKVVSQVSGMIDGLKDARPERQQHLQTAMDTLNSDAINLEALKNKITESRGKTTWLVAEIVEGLSNHYATPPLPTEFNVMATDGSHIDVDRHRTARCCLINIGSIMLHYGSEPYASLESIPYLFSNDEEMVIASPDTGSREQMLEGNLLGIRRAVEECHQLVTLSEALPADSQNLALLDGTLILWGLEAYPDFVGDVLLTGGMLACLDNLKKQNADKKLALASYISFPRSTDVVNALRVALCPREVVNTDQCKNCKTRECETVAGVRDRDVFMEILAEGERSALFISPSKIVREHYGEHCVYFFYLRAEDEVARVEIPQWVAEDKELLELTHSLLLDQCRRGQGYPVTLSEAHEKAVVTGADRETFWQMVEAAMIEEHMPVNGSAKDMSKRTRWV